MIEFKIAITCLIISSASFLVFKASERNSNLEGISAIITIAAFLISAIAIIVGVWNV